MKFAALLVVTVCLTATASSAGKCDPKADKCPGCTKCVKCASCTTGGQACSVKRDELTRSLPLWKRLLLR